MIAHAHPNWKSGKGLKGFLYLSLLLLLMGSCSSSPETTASAQAHIKIDGSSTVYPITQKAVERFQRGNDVSIAVQFSGTGGGFKKFCTKETDINNASRPINKSEMEACKAAGVQYLELPVAFDALTIAVHPDNSWAEDIALEELKQIWEPGAEGMISSWNQVRSSWPDQPLKLFGPGRDSGTFDYFTAMVVGEKGVSRSDYTASEDDNVLVAGVSGDPNALGYFGLGYYAENWEILKSLGVDNGKGPVQPTVEAVKTALYKPLSRPLFIYVNAEAVETKPELKAFVDYYLEDVPAWVPFVGYIPLSEEIYALTTQRFQNHNLGTGYGGTLQPDLTLEAMFKKDTIS